MDAQTHIELHLVLLRHAGVEWSHGFHHPQPGPHRPLGVILMGVRVAEVDEQPVAEVLRDMPLIAGDHLGAGVLVGPHHLPPRFRVELAGQHRRVYQITEQHRELAAFGLRRTRLRSMLGPLGLWDARRRLWQYSSISSPHEHGARLVDRQLLDLDDLSLQIVQIGVI
jgi:hypothetical protein